MALPPGRVREKCQDAARLHYQCSKKDSAMDSGWVAGSVDAAVPSQNPQLEHAETCSTAEATRGYHAGVHAVVCGMKLADPGITAEPRLTASQSNLADIFTTAAVLGRSAALDVCVASSIAAAARGDAAQAAFDRTTDMKSENSDSCVRRIEESDQSSSTQSNSTAGRGWSNSILENQVSSSESIFTSTAFHGRTKCNARE